MKMYLKIAIAWDSTFVPFSNLSFSKTPIGPFHKMVCASFMTSIVPSSKYKSRIISSSDISVTDFTLISSPSKLLEVTTVDGNIIFPCSKILFAIIPIATILLVKSGITSKASLVKARPYLLVLFLIIGMLLTPPDIFSQLFLAIPMWILFELGIFFIREK